MHSATHPCEAPHAPLAANLAPGLDWAQPELPALLLRHPLVMLRLHQPQRRRPHWYCLVYCLVSCMYCLVYRSYCLVYRLCCLVYCGLAVRAPTARRTAACLCG